MISSLKNYRGFGNNVISELVHYSLLQVLFVVTAFLYNYYHYCQPCYYHHVVIITYDSYDITYDSIFH